MALIYPVPDLHSYSSVLEQAKAMLRVMGELNTGIRPGEERAGCPRLMSGHTSITNANED